MKKFHHRCLQNKRPTAFECVETSVLVGGRQPRPLDSQNPPDPPCSMLFFAGQGVRWVCKINARFCFRAHWSPRAFGPPARHAVLSGSTLNTGGAGGAAVIGKTFAGVSGVYFANTGPPPWPRNENAVGEGALPATLPVACQANGLRPRHGVSPPDEAPPSPPIPPPPLLIHTAKQGVALVCDDT